MAVVRLDHGGHLAGRRIPDQEAIVVAKARELLEATQIPIEGVATETGFGSADAMRHHFRLRLGTSPAHYRAAFRTPAN